MSKIQSPEEISKHHEQLFAECSAKYRSLFKTLETVIEHNNTVLSESKSKLSELNELKREQAVTNKSADDKLRQAEISLEAANAKLKESTDKSVIIDKLHAELDARDKALCLQRDEIAEREQLLKKRIADVEISERGVMYARQQVERLMVDNKIKNFLLEDIK